MTFFGDNYDADNNPEYSDLTELVFLICFES